MLKFERGSRDQSINIIVRDKDRFMTRSLMYAFGLAVLYHLIFILIFHISPFKLKLSQVIFPPIQVEADSVKHMAVLAHLDNQQSISSGLPPRESMIPSIQDSPGYTSRRPFEYAKEKYKQTPLFQRIESEVYQPTFSAYKLNTREPPPARLVISGLLSEQVVLADGLENKRFPSKIGKGSENEWRIIYNVLVEGKSGKIFWFEPVEQTNIKAIDSLAVEILKDFQIIPTHDTYVVAGEIELHLNL